MKIIAAYKHEGKPNRHLLSVNGQLYRRIYAVVRPVYQVLERPQWQEQIHNGEFHNVIGAKETELEKQFQEIVSS